MENFKIDKRVFIAVSAIVIVVIAIGCFAFLNNTKDDYVEIDNNITQVSNVLNEETKENKIYIHIVGAINNPGLVELQEGERISDSINMAGGLTPDADVSKINLAYVVEDGQKIVIPSINAKQEDNEEKEELISSKAGSNVIEETTVSSEKVNINTANQTELETISGIGPSLASKIIQYRTINGKFKSIEDLKNVPGIGDAKFENIKAVVIVK